MLSSFTPNQKAASVFAMDHDHRLDWHFIPKERKGTSLKEMSPQQRHLTTALLAASLSAKGLVKTSNIMSLEEVLMRNLPRGPAKTQRGDAGPGGGGFGECGGGFHDRS